MTVTFTLQKISSEFVGDDPFLGPTYQNVYIGQTLVEGGMPPYSYSYSYPFPEPPFPEEWGPEVIGMAPIPGPGPGTASVTVTDSTSATASATASLVTAPGPFQGPVPSPPSGSGGPFSPGAAGPPGSAGGARSPVSNSPSGGSSSGLPVTTGDAGTAHQEYAPHPVGPERAMCSMSNSNSDSTPTPGGGLFKGPSGAG